ncbi:MAG: hypothetical protein RR712_00095 [Terrisporobacter sp.]|uniref:hypothetical protein n=1 Tax=Terrisporobacter sp. TaxID=1965305 RepID=UPI002FCC5FFF
MSKRKFYRNFNKRKRFNFSKAITITICVCIIGTYAYVNLKDNEFIDKFANINIVSSIKKISPVDFIKSLFGKSDVITSSDISTELEELEKDKDDKKENVQVASVNDMTVYTIQVASLDDKSELKNIESIMEEYKIPSANMSIDKADKIQVYSSFDESKVRKNLEKTKTYFSDAFITKIEVPMLSLEYTSSYSYMKDIADNLNDLTANFKKENEYWDKGEKDLKTFNEILTSRKAIIENLKKEIEKIDYKKMDSFKENLNSYLESLEKNIVNSSKDANENKGYLSQGLLLSSVQDYYIFVNSMK